MNRFGATGGYKADATCGVPAAGRLHDCIGLAGMALQLVDMFRPVPLLGRLPL